MLKKILNALSKLLGLCSSPEPGLALFDDIRLPNGGLQAGNIPSFPLSIESKPRFTQDYKNIVANISDPAEIPNLRVNRNVPPKEVFSVTLSYFGEEINLFYRSLDYYLLGFLGDLNVFYYFSDSSLTDLPGAASSKNLGYTGSYIQIGMPGVFTQGNVISYVTTLQTFTGSNPNRLKRPLSTLIFSTAEAFRFKSVAKNLLAIIETTKSMDSALYEDDVKNWATLSAQTLQGKIPPTKINIAKKY